MGNSFRHPLLSALRYAIRLAQIVANCEIQARASAAVQAVWDLDKADLPIIRLVS
jgi:hypothetical protein